MFDMSIEGEIDYAAKSRWSLVRHRGRRNYLINHGQHQQLIRW
jgi:hypothetical protein